MKSFSRVALTVLACVAALGGCGGGGGGGDADAPTTPPPVVGTPEPPSVLAGSIWHSFSDLDTPAGTFVLNPNTGVSSTVQTEEGSVPWPDGSRFIDRDYDTTNDETRLSVRRTADKTVVTDQVVDGYVGLIFPSPANADHILAYWGENIFSPRGAVVWDLGAKKLLFSAQPGKTPDALSWMPDGGLLRVKPSGDISKLVLGGTEQALATVAWPESRIPQAVYVSPDGNKALVQLAALRETGSVSGVDLWVMDINGGNLKRFTNNGLITDAHWSPDGQYVAFTKDTGVACTEATCQGSCTVWYAPASATNVVAVEAAGDAKRFPVQRPNGSVTNLRCPVTAWTR